MKKTILSVLLFLGMSAMVFANTIVVQQTDQNVGYDGDCKIYFRPDFGYFEVCQEREPIYIGTTFTETTYKWHNPGRHGFWHYRNHDQFREMKH